VKATKTTVVHVRDAGGFDVAIHRPQYRRGQTKAEFPWGNPYTIGADGTRAEVIAKYERWLLEGDGRHLLPRIHELKGKRLACFCAPEPCHGDVLAELADALPDA